ncbi:Dockerin type 1 [Coniochaeta hoffmannii]|uniref:Dockerin type 1 n=1 Tax=Coniochaeta hoffmannii TaxID=91930 RepID=A0AA38S860_9PEZI|nr:Dockerin type 1 [Coniochaeta hoffmannii]
MVMSSITKFLLTVGCFARQLTAVTPPTDFQANPKVGPGGTKYKDSPHFRIYNAPNDSIADASIKSLESAYSCFIGDLGWRSTGLSFRQETDDGPFYKLNVYRVDTLPGAAANTGTDQASGLSFLNVVTQYMTEPSITVHEFGHAMTYAARYWIDQGRTGAWWETVAQFVADTYITSPVCAAARARYGQAEGKTMIDLGKVIGDSYQVIVDGSKNTGNYYQAWPFFVYLFNNPDNYTGLGHDIFPNVWTKYKRNSNETPLHVLGRLVSPVKIQEVMARYWARMAYVDIGHAKAQAQFLSQRRSLNYANLDSQAGGRYKVKAARQPRYMGASIIPLKGTGTVGVNVTANAPFTATLAVQGAGGAVSYVPLPKGSGQAVVGSGEEATLVVVNTPDALYLYDPFSFTADVSRGLDYQVLLTGASA